MTRTDLQNYILESLGCPVVKVELTDAQITLAINDAIRRYKDFGSDGTYRAMYVLDLIAHTQEYTMPSNVYEVVDVIDQTAARALTTNVIDPYLNIFSPGQQQGLTLVEIGTAYLENVQRMFTKMYEFYQRKDSSGNVILSFKSEVRYDTKIVLIVEQVGNEETILGDPWVKAWALAKAKHILGTIRGKYGQYAGPGGTTLDGDTLRAEANDDMRELDQRLIDYHRRPIGLIVG